MLGIEIKEKFFNKNILLKNINISFSEGEFISIIGPSGCGKNSLLNIIASLDKDY